MKLEWCKMQALHSGAHTSNTALNYAEYKLRVN